MQKRRVADKSELVKSTKKCFLEKESFRVLKLAGAEGGGSWVGEMICVEPQTWKRQDPQLSLGKKRTSEHGLRRGNRGCLAKESLGD